VGFPLDKNILCEGDVVNPLEKLKTLAEAATKGQWKVGYEDESGLFDKENRDFFLSANGKGLFHADCFHATKEDSDFIAACSPETILALLQLVELYQRAKEWHDQADWDGAKEKEAALLERLERSLG